jgi:hypothetical protein
MTVVAEERRRGPRSRTLLLIALPIALVLSAGLIWQASYAAFTVNTDNNGSTFTAGSISLTDNDLGSAMFTTLGNMKPGDSATQCISVTYTGTLATTAVKLYATVTHTGGGPPNLASYLTVRVEEGSATGATYPACGTYTAASTLINDVHLASIGTTYATGVGAWTPAAGDSKVYRFTVTLDPSAPSTVGGQTETVKFTWETNSS